MIQKFKNTKLVQSHINSTINNGADMAKMHLDPSEGVLYQPDIEKEETIKGKPYKQKQREFQKTFLENIGRRNHITHHHKNGSSNFSFFQILLYFLQIILIIKNSY